VTITSLLWRSLRNKTVQGKLQGSVLGALSARRNHNTSLMLPLVPLNGMLYWRCDPASRHLALNPAQLFLTDR
jgi:hypothetical protein